MTRPCEVILGLSVRGCSFAASDVYTRRSYTAMIHPGYTIGRVGLRLVRRSP